MRLPVALLIASLLCLTAVARAEVKVKTSRQTDAATAAFKHDGIPLPSATDAAVAGKVTLAGGRADANGGSVKSLIDGKLPANADAPADNFFFGIPGGRAGAAAGGAGGGRILIDLTAATDVTQINTYSWHAGARAPQVYKVYAADGTAQGFLANPARNVDPATVGWSLLASVDTKPKEGDAGGQYAVSIADEDASKPLGKFRYILLAVSPAGPGPQDQTFFSEIDIHDGKQHTPPPVRPDAITVLKFDKYEVKFDTTETPDLTDWVNAELKPVVQKWYPMIVEVFPSENYTAPLKFSITFHDNTTGVAYASGTEIHGSAPWYRTQLKNEALGSLVHEMVHVVQQYRRARGGAPNPGWLVEGVADFFRWHKYEPVEKRRKLNPARIKYTDSYHVTGAFLDWADQKNKDLVVKLNAAMREGKYSPDLWKAATGKTIDDLWADYIVSLGGTRPTTQPATRPAAAR